MEVNTLSYVIEAVEVGGARKRVSLHCEVKGEGQEEGSVLHMIAMGERDVCTISLH